MRRVVVFGVDGVRTDALREASTPHIDGIAARGFYHEFELSHDAPTMSGPTWATVATGQWPRLHGVYTNNFPGNRLGSFPDFLARVRHSGRKTYLATSWSPLATSEFGGPIFRCPTRSTFINADDIDYSTVDEELADDAVRVLSTHDISASFIYLGNPDHVAHHVGTHEPYVEAIEAADRQIGRILEALAGRTAFETETWTYIVVTDHGHLDGGGHGGRTPYERTAWVAACGPGIAADAQAPTPSIAADAKACHVDIAPTVLRAVGVPIHPEDGLAGEAFQKT